MCDACGASATYSETISTDSGLKKRSITTSGCPNHYSVCTGKPGLAGCGGDGGEGTATEAKDQGKTIHVPAEPVLSSVGADDVECSVGEIATALNGVSIYSGAVDGGCTLLGVVDPSSEWIDFDMCSGHSAPNGDYHYHFPPSCLLAQAEATNPTGTGHSPQVGWAWDGFPIYGPLYTGGIALSHADLDECSGKHEELPAVDNFKYRYYMVGATSNLYALPSHPKPTEDAYPFVPKCFKGCKWADLQSGSCTGASGVTASYVATAHSGYTAQFAGYATSGSNYLGETYASSYLSDGVCSSSSSSPPSPSPLSPSPPSPSSPPRKTRPHPPGKRQLYEQELLRRLEQGVVNATRGSGL